MVARLRRRPATAVSVAAAALTSHVAGKDLGPTERGQPIRTVRYTEPLTIDAFWQDIYQPGEPVLIKGLVAGTPIMELFSTEGLRNGPFSQYRHRVSFRRGHGEGPRNPYSIQQEGWQFREAETWLANQRGAQEGGPQLGAAIMQESTGREDVLRTLLGSLPPSLWLPAHEVQPSFWVNFNATPMASGLHFDPFDNFFMAIEGKKTFQIFPYGQGDRLEPDRQFMSYSSMLYPIYGMAGLDPSELRQKVLDPDVDRFPGFADARGTTVELEPADVLYLPSGYWHGGLHDGLTVGVSFWWLVLCPHERVFEFWMRHTPDDDNQADWAEEPLTEGFYHLAFPSEPSRRPEEDFGTRPERPDQEDQPEEVSERVDFHFLEEQRREAGCFRSNVGSFEDLEAKLVAIGDPVSCVRDWYKKYWDKLDKLARDPMPSSEAALQKYLGKLHRGGMSLEKKCGRKLRDFSYDAMLEAAFPGCRGSPHDECDEILRRTRAALRSVISWEKCPDDKAEL